MTDQPELPNITPEGYPEEQKPAPSWLNVCEIAVNDLATTWLWLDVVATVAPNLTAGSHDILTQASDRFARIIMQEVGRRSWHEAVNRATEVYNRQMRAAITATEAES